MKNLVALSIISIASVVLLGAAQNPSAAIRGTIVFTGTLQARLINMASEPSCPQGPQAAQGQDDVIVYATPRTQVPYTASSIALLLDRVGCQFVPHTMTMQAGQTLTIRNSDPAAHNAHGWPSVNMPFNTSLLPGSSTTQYFTQEEVVIPIRDDVHNWENANVAVFSHPYHTVSKLNGTYEFSLPGGNYDIVAWHERLGKQSLSIELSSGESQVVDFIFK